LSGTALLYEFSKSTQAGKNLDFQNHEYFMLLGQNQIRALMLDNCEPDFSKMCDERNVV